ncbi:MAG: hypothetical protein K2P14_03695 [Anaeroplasmataceae bacterium]|nr:hypothetical protein [Anaeroplasmataceae bacterium]
MSRSYKKFPLFRDCLWGRSMKRGKQFANRKIRRKLRNPNVDISNGRYYKYLGIDSWNLYEYKHHQTEQDVISEWEARQKRIINGIDSQRLFGANFALNEEIQFWKSSYLRK